MSIYLYIFLTIFLSGWLAGLPCPLLFLPALAAYLPVFQAPKILFSVCLFVCLPVLLSVFMYVRLWKVFNLSKSFNQETFLIWTNWEISDLHNSNTIHIWNYREYSDLRYSIIIPINLYKRLSTKRDVPNSGKNWKSQIYTIHATIIPMQKWMKFLDLHCTINIPTHLY